MVRVEYLEAVSTAVSSCVAGMGLDSLSASHALLFHLHSSDVQVVLAASCTKSKASK